MTQTFIEHWVNSIWLNLIQIKAYSIHTFSVNFDLYKFYIDWLIDLFKYECPVRSSKIYKENW